MYDNNQSRQLKNKLLLITNSGGSLKYTKKTAQKSKNIPTDPQQTLHQTLRYMLLKNHQSGHFHRINK